MRTIDPIFGWAAVNTNGLILLPVCRTRDEVIRAIGPIWNAANAKSGWRRAQRAGHVRAIRVFIRPASGYGFNVAASVTARKEGQQP